MNKSMEKKPVLHAVIWIMIYIMTVNIGGALSESTRGLWRLQGILCRESFFTLYLTSAELLPTKKAACRPIY